MVSKRLILVAIFGLFFSVFSLFGSPVKAEDVNGIEVTPSVIDEKVKARDILEYTVTITNNSTRKADIYAMVNDLSVTDGKQEFIEPSKLDKSTSLARWINFKRALIEVMPGATVEVPLRVEVSPFATPGKRYAVITLAEGPNKSSAESYSSRQVFPRILLNYEVVENIVEKAQIKNFFAGKNIYFELPAAFRIAVENSGNQEIVPTGNIYIQNRRGQEAGVLAVDFADQPIAPGSTGEIALSWQPEHAFGKFKAKLEMKYGGSEGKDLQDTIYFWILPWPFLAAFLGGTIILVVFLVIILYRRTYHHHVPATAVVNGQAGDDVIDLRNS